MAIIIEFYLACNGSIRVYNKYKMAGVLMTFAAVLYLCISATVYLLFKPNIMRNLVDFGAEYSQVQRKMIRDMEVPYCLLDESGKVMWTNNEMVKYVKKILEISLLHLFLKE